MFIRSEIRWRFYTITSTQYIMYGLIMYEHIQVLYSNMCVPVCGMHTVPPNHIVPSYCVVESFCTGVYRYIIYIHTYIHTYSTYIHTKEEDDSLTWIHNFDPITGARGAPPIAPSGARGAPPIAPSSILCARMRAPRRPVSGFRTWWGLGVKGFRVYGYSSIRVSVRV